MNILKKGICIVMTLAMAQCIGMTAFTPASAATTEVKTVSTSATTAAKPTKVTLNKTSATLTVGKTMTLKATVTPKNASTKLTWTSSNKKIATVDSSGKVKGVKAGTATITVKTSNGKSASCKVTVITKQQEYINEVVRLVNVERTKRGLSKLTATTALTNAANKRATEIHTKFSHTRPNGKAWSTVLKDYKISYSTSGENIAAGYATPAAVVKGWMESPGHKSNILNKNYKKIGVGYASYKDGYGSYWTQLFIG